MCTAARSKGQARGRKRETGSGLAKALPSLPCPALGPAVSPASPLQVRNGEQSGVTAAASAARVDGNPELEREVRKEAGVVKPLPISLLILNALSSPHPIQRRGCRAGCSQRMACGGIIPDVSSACVTGLVQPGMGDGFGQDQAGGTRTEVGGGCVGRDPPQHCSIKPACIAAWPARSARTRPLQRVDNRGQQRVGQGEADCRMRLPFFSDFFSFPARLSFHWLAGSRCIAICTAEPS